MPSHIGSISSERVIKYPHLKGSFPCTTCGTVFTHAASLRRHRQINHNNEILCLVCNVQLGKVETVQQHMQMIHKMGKVFTCGCCSNTYGSKKDLNTHFISMKKNEGPGDVNPIAYVVEPKKLVDVEKLGSLSPKTVSSCSSSPDREFSDSPTTLSEEISPVVVPVVAPSASVLAPLDEDSGIFDENLRRLINDKVELMLSNGLYSDNQLVMVETWVEILDKALGYVDKDLNKTNRGRPVKRPARFDD